MKGNFYSISMYVLYFSMYVLYFLLYFLFIFGGLRFDLIGGRRLKGRDTYLNERKIIHMKLQNYVIFSFQVTNNYRYNV